MEFFNSLFPVCEPIMNKSRLCVFWVQHTLIISCLTGCTIHCIFKVHTLIQGWTLTVWIVLEWDFWTPRCLLQYDWLLLNYPLLKDDERVLILEQHWHSHALLVVVVVSAIIVHIWAWYAIPALALALAVPILKYSGAVIPIMVTCRKNRLTLCQSRMAFYQSHFDSWTLLRHQWVNLHLLKNHAI